MQVKVDFKRLDRDVDRVNDRLRAIRKTLEDPGAGEVLVSKRTKIPGVKGRAVHGRAIANTLRANGMDPFEYPDALVQRVQERLARRIVRARDRAYRRRTRQTRLVHEALEAAAKELAEWAADHVRSGGLGRRKTDKKSMDYWNRMVRLGRVTDKYGIPPPRGIRSGQFVDGPLTGGEGIRGRWRRQFRR